MTSDTIRRDRQHSRDKLLEAALPHVVFDGWGMKALTSGAADAGISTGQIHAVFVNPERDLLMHLSDWADRRMLLRLAEMDLPSMKVRQRITAAVRVRIEAFSGHEEAVRLAIGSLATPGNATMAARNVYRTVDSIWRVADDEATDFNFYTKRGLLAAVLTSSMLYWLNDTSDHHEETWSFLDRRIEDVMKIPKLQARITSEVQKFTSRIIGSESRAPGG
jgi:ubiquinone biosynthesis protein COQ9